MQIQDNPNASSKIAQIQSLIQEIRKDFHKKHPRVIGRVIGKGSYGHIILNQTQDTKNEYVVKKGDVTRNSNTNQLKFYNQILKQKQVHTDYYPTIYTTDEDILNTYIVMEYLDPEKGWKSLHDIYIHNYKHPDNKINLGTYFVIMNTILDHFHEKNIIHNDIKNENIMINIRTRDVKFIDFGCSFTNETCGTDIKILQQGTPLYMLPIDENQDMTEERIMELGKQKDRFALKVCQFCHSFEKEYLYGKGFLLDIPTLIETTIPEVKLYKVLYKWLLKRGPAYGSLQNIIKTEYKKLKHKYEPQRDKFNDMFEEFIKK